MNLSDLSVYDNLPISDENYSKSCIYRTINDLLNINDDVEIALFCPLCVCIFEYKFSLFEHLESFHHNFLVRASDRCLRFTECSFCSAKFYGKHLLARHSLLHHAKVIRELFLDERSECFFCGDRLESRESGTVTKHIEEMHFVDFEEEYGKRFSSTISQMTFSEFITVTVGNSISHSGSDTSFHSCIDFSDDGSTTNSQPASIAKDFDEASRINCFDFAELKEQLQNIKNVTKTNECDFSCKKKSILKNIINQSRPNSVRRVLRFDLPDCSPDNKENALAGDRSFCGVRRTQNDNYDISCDDSLRMNVETFFNNSHNDWSVIPIHSSTPNTRVTKANGTVLVKGGNQNSGEAKCSNFKSYINLKDHTIYDYQCGRCRMSFKENLELVGHIKNSHKKFGLNGFKPCYRCGICNARFYKNCYLQKHHRLHKPY